MREIIPNHVPFSEYGQYIIEHFHQNPILKESIWENLKYPEKSDTYKDFKRTAKRLMISSCFYIFGSENNIRNLTDEQQYVVECIRTDVDVDISKVKKAFPGFSAYFDWRIPNK